MSAPEGSGNIPFIHNYCDSWCERCEFTARCLSFAMQREMGLGLEESGDPMSDALATVATALAEAKRMLLEKADEMGIDLMAEANKPEIVEGIERTRATVESNEAVELAKRYALETRHVLDDAEEWAGDADADPLIAEMLSIVQWYLFFIAAKVHRGYHSTLDIDGYDVPEQIEDPQSDANGSIKVALISIERSVLAWTYLINETNAHIIRPVIRRLEEIKSLLETKFPNSRDFIRPGFDEIETVM
jgi:hypothetical protein